MGEIAGETGDGEARRRGGLDALRPADRLARVERRNEATFGAGQLGPRPETGEGIVRALGAGGQDEGGEGEREVARVHGPIPSGRR